MKIVIVTAHFMPEIGYQEVILARVLARQGHSVAVLTTALISPEKSSLVSSGYKVGIETMPDGVEIVRLPHIWKLGAMIRARNVYSTLMLRSPDLVLVLGVGKLFPGPVLRPSNKREYRLISFFGDNQDFLPKGGWKQRIINLRVRMGKRIVKQAIVRRAIVNSDVVVCYTPETKRILGSFISTDQKEALNSKYMETCLGFDSEEYYFDEQARADLRRELGIGDDELLLVTTTRLVPRKQIENVIQAIGELLKQNLPLHYLIVGGMRDAYEQRLQEIIYQTGHLDNFTIFPFLPTAEKRRCYSAGDIGIWENAAITIQEAMGTGLSVLLPDKPSVSHLVTNAGNGWLYSSLEDGLRTAVADMQSRTCSDRLETRRNAEETNRKLLSYDTLAKEIISQK